MIVSVLEDAWRALCADHALNAVETEPLFHALSSAYGAPERHYHGLSHLNHVFEELASVSHALDEPPRALWAAWFHDAVYDTRRADNEEQSAQWAEAALARLGLEPGLIARVAALIRATARHTDTPSDRTDALFLDADRAILGAPQDAYDRYVAGVRAEYHWVDDGLWTQGRRAFLDGQRANAQVFHTALFETRYAAQARANMAREHTALTNAAGGGGGQT